MKLKTLTIAALVLGLSAPLSFAQESGGSDGAESSAGGATTGAGGEDAANYLTGPNIRTFFADDNFTMRSDDEMSSAWGAMNESDRANLKSSCATNTDANFNDFCAKVNTWQ
jgi:hypothetical protein